MLTWFVYCGVGSASRHAVPKRPKDPWKVSSAESWRVIRCLRSWRIC